MTTTTIDAPAAGLATGDLIATFYAAVKPFFTEAKRTAPARGWMVAHVFSNPHVVVITVHPREGEAREFHAHGSPALAEALAAVLSAAVRPLPEADRARVKALVDAGDAELLAVLAPGVERINVVLLPRDGDAELLAAIVRPPAPVH